jgi:hypothetical protein
MQQNCFLAVEWMVDQGAADIPEIRSSNRERGAKR